MKRYAFKPPQVLDTAIQIAEKRASTSARLLVISNVRSDVKTSMEKIVRRAWRMARTDSTKRIQHDVSTTKTNDRNYDESAISMWNDILKQTTENQDLVVSNFRKDNVGVNEYFPRWVREFVCIKNENNDEDQRLGTFLASIVSTDDIAVEEFLLEALCGCVVVSRDSFVVRTILCLLCVIDEKWKLTQLRAKMKVLNFI